jgi:hypothetical protein
MTTAVKEHPAVAAWKAMSDETLAGIDSAILPGTSPHQDALRRLFLRQRLDYHRARFMYSAIALASTLERDAEGAVTAIAKASTMPRRRPQ